MVDKDTTFQVMMSFCKTSENGQLTSSKLTAYQTETNVTQMQIRQSGKVNFSCNTDALLITFPMRDNIQNVNQLSLIFP